VNFNWVNKEGVAAELKDAVVLVTGAACSVGSGIVRLLMDFKCKQVILLDQAELPLSELQKDLLQPHFPTLQDRSFPSQKSPN
jgi:FlaA1/EpsC-like NDP-sugar epimerase